ncbi:glucose-1-phosphate thymidylyltransferase [Pedobacter yulinensis]|uniref:Glucose-1-phosphate thymidylyltransferase n=1 Tax=Pedobacter yulinensis TaxID=2126353 RepID=A0A2T3HI60_9SPHI|nr:putative sugar nucleotidyl transferase [Pedobacter yulinensis]PST82135.1 glucose-1-phosphate thymidylyltransferase [Pedobacter yulinensis]
MAFNLFDDTSWSSLRPLTFTRPVADLRIGILTIAEKWAARLSSASGFCTQTYLQAKFSALQAPLFINGSICPDNALTDAVQALKTGQALWQEQILIAYAAEPASAHDEQTAGKLDRIAFDGPFLKLTHPEDIFRHNGPELNKDFDLLTKGRNSATLSNTNTFLGERVFAEEGASAECSVFNSLQGPIYLGRNSQVWESSNIRGSFALCHDSQVKMGAKIYPNTTIGPFSRVGGEINNAVIWGFSSKGHEGYLGNSVMGQWCNIGADSNNSNLKNNYANVRLWDYERRSPRDTGLQFCGMIMADHVKCAINTMFNTGTVVGVGSNVFAAGFPRSFMPDFSWGGGERLEVYRLEKMLETAARVFERRGMTLDETERSILSSIFELTDTYRYY